MIKEIKFENIATYGNVLIYPKKVNYIYGGNGVGKTTLSNIIKEDDKKIIIDSSNTSKIVYNKKFVDENFYEDNEIKGIFTLGQEQKEIREEINGKIRKINENNQNIEKENISYSGLVLNKTSKETELEEYVWELKVEYYDVFNQIFKGNIGSKKIFLNKIKQELKKTKDLEVKEYSNLKEKYELIFSKKLVEYETLKITSLKNINILYLKSELKEPIVGKDNKQISELILKLGNSDWVNKGMSYLTEEKICPFCQQQYQIDLKKELEDLFDQSYSTKISEIKEFSKSYGEYYQKLRNEILEEFSKVEILNLDLLKLKFQNLLKKIEENRNKYETKINSPSIVINEVNINQEVKDVEEEIEKLLNKIIENNELKRKYLTEKQNLENSIWSYLCSKKREHMDKCLKTISGLEQGIKNIRNKITNYRLDNEFLNQEKEKLEGKISNVEKTKNEINLILKQFGFLNFKLEVENEKFYKIIRPCGEEALKTLSEGEKTFLTFIYFYQLIHGSYEKDKQMMDKVIVIDDPISSLDSNVIFIVSNLTKKLIQNCLKNQSIIKQVFILTHNIYFHKEVTYKGLRESSTADEKYFTIRKISGKSLINEEEKNPIQTTYDLLWDEIRNIENVNKVTIFNTMRRILEYYFNIIGGIKYEDAEEKFDENEKIIFKSLISWINDGSHCVYDDLLLTCDLDQIERYLEVFKKTFKVLNHEGHYDMMMNK